MNFFIPIIIIGVLALITVLLMGLEQLLGGNSQKTVTINNKQIIPVTETDTLLNTLSKEKIFIPSACGGKATCGACKFRLIEGGGDVKPTEEPFLSESEKKQVCASAVK
jgi:Na+-transporting NADH:ubiquinone oxidoreductase subunit F